MSTWFSSKDEYLAQLPFVCLFPTGFTESPAEQNCFTFYREVPRCLLFCLFLQMRSPAWQMVLFWIFALVNTLANSSCKPSWPVVWKWHLIANAFGLTIDSQIVASSGPQKSLKTMNFGNVYSDLIVAHVVNKLISAAYTSSTTTSNNILCKFNISLFLLKSSTFHSILGISSLIPNTGQMSKSQSVTLHCVAHRIGTDIEAPV